MTREEAIKLLSQMFLIQFTAEEHNALGMAIDALNCSEKPNGSLISRQDALDILDDFEADVELGERDSYKVYREKLLSLASRITEHKTFCGVPIKEAARIVQEHNADKPTGDLISRQDAIRWVKTECNLYGKPTLDFESGKRVIEHLEQMPSADRPTGMWISEELANMICDEICYYKEVTVDANSLNDLCEGCLIKKKKYGRPTGEWIKSNILPNGWHCSHCDAPVMTDDITEMLFCPHCGSYNGGEEE